MTNEITTGNGAGGISGLRNALLPSSFSEVLRFADMVKDTEFVPKDFRGKAGHIVAAVTYGAELGLTPMQALQSMAVINGRPSLFGDGLLAVCKGHPQWVGMEESIAGAGEARTATCIVRRKGQPDVMRTFSMADAKRAGLTGKQGPWSAYPDRMLQMRARGFALRDQFADALRGVISADEARDTPRDVTPVEQQRTNAETRRAAMEEIEAVEVVSVYGDVQHVLPAELPGWIAEQLSESVTDDALAEWGAANLIAVPGIDEAVKAELIRRAKKAAVKPNGSSGFVVRDAAGRGAGSFESLDSALSGLRAAVKAMSDDEAAAALGHNRALLERSQEAVLPPALGKWAGDQLDWLTREPSMV